MATGRRPSDLPRKHEARRTKNVLPILGPAFVALALFAATAKFDYVWDERSVVHESLPALDGPTAILFPPHAIGDFNQYYRPAAYAVLRILFWLAGPSAAAFHLFAVLVHAACAALVAWLALRLLAETEHRGAGALAAGLVFAVHPAHVEAVAWIGATTESLATFWALACLLAYDLARRRGSGSLALLAAGFAFLAFASKETALLLPAGVVGLELHGLAERRGVDVGRALRRLAPIAAALVGYLLLRRLSLGGWITSPEVTDVERGGLAVLPGALTYYLEQLLLPLAACPFVPTVPPASAASLVLALALAALAGVAAHRLWPRSFAACFGIGWMFVSLAPPLLLAMHTVAAAPLAERYVYFASVGLALVAGCFVAVGGLWLRARQLAVAVLVAIGALATMNRLPAFAGHGSFWQAASKCSPHHCLPLTQLADDAQAQGRADEALALYRAALERPCKPQQVAFAKAHLGVTLYRAGKGEEAESLWRESIALYPGYSVPHYMLARTAIERAARSNGDDAAADYALAEEQLAAASALRPNDAEYLYALGQVQYLRGRRDESRSSLTRALGLDPNHPAAASARAMMK